jgi:tRNA A-37 threonylcarbamoyl transferase component Bud32
VVRVGRERTTKRHRTEAAAEAEAEWYQRVPWAAPRLLDVDGATLVLETRPPALRLPGWRPVDELYALLLRLHAEGIHHRDVHVGNVVRGPDGPQLIDWETATRQPSALSYDLYGPDASGVPVPGIHARHIPQWWGSQQRMSIKSRWGCDVPAEAA